ncbi:MAG: succinylglutamate desuccinylase/aspartoacylase family protein [Gammaproteobacteria bacterium]
MATRKRRPAFEIHDTRVAAGSTAALSIPVAGLYTAVPVNMPLHVVHGRSEGPTLLVSAAVHGDEINGVEIIRRLLRMPALKRLKGTLIAAPIVNVFGFLNRSRYLPDRRDLNRSFPGSESGSLAGRVAGLFLEEVVKRCNYGIDLHTAAIHRDNLPQIRADLEDPEIERLARAFGAPVALHSNIIEGSLRGAGRDMDVRILTYEAGEALRFHEFSIHQGVVGCINILRALEMLPPSRRKSKPSTVLRSSTWVRAGQSGILRAHSALGAAVNKGDVLGVIADPFGEQEAEVLAPSTGIVIGRTNLPLAHEGEALFHIGRTQRAETLVEEIEALQSESDLRPVDDIGEPAIV